MANINQNRQTEFYIEQILLLIENYWEPFSVEKILNTIKETPTLILNAASSRPPIHPSILLNELEAEEIYNNIELYLIGRNLAEYLPFPKHKELVAKMT